MRFLWKTANHDPLFSARLTHELKLTPLLAQCLVNRGLSDPAEAALFLEPRLKNLHDPFEIPGMTQAVDRLFAARDRAEPVMVFGDYDVDGVTSSALLMEVLEHFGWIVHGFLPHRLNDGYGLTQSAVEKCLAGKPVKVVLAVDCGTSSAGPVAWLRGQGIDVIVVDHHPAAVPADATVLVNPWAGTDSATQLEAHGSSSLKPFQELCSVGLAFKLAHALVKRGRLVGLPTASDFSLKPLLDLVCLGTISDQVPLIRENRILAAAGLAGLNTTERPGLRALKEIAQCSTPVTCHDAGFLLGPRLNAAGRLETAQTALRLLRSLDEPEAAHLAQQLDDWNKKRQQIERCITEEAVESIRCRFDPSRDRVIVEGRASWHIGVMGIVASRILQQFHCPVVIVGGDEAEWRGSGRSIAGFDLAAALAECGDLLVRHGGHAMAAGLSVAPANIDAFRQRLNEIARRSLTADALRPLLRLDARVALRDLTIEHLRLLDRLKPYGCANATVQFYAGGLRHARPLQRIGVDRQHVKMWVTDGSGIIEALWWNAGEEVLPVGSFDLAFAPQANHYNGSTTVQLKVLDWRPTLIE